MTDTAAQRIELVDLDNLTEEQAEAVASLTIGPHGVQGPFRLLLHNPSLMQATYGQANRIRYHSTLPDDLRELATLVAAKVWEQGFEWEVHAPLAEEAGVSKAAVEAIARGERPPALSEKEAAVYDFSVQLHETKQVDDEVYARVNGFFGVAGVLELCWLGGFYASLAMVMNVARLAPSWKEAAGA